MTELPSYYKHSQLDLRQLISESGITTEPPSAENLFRWIHDTLTNPNPWKFQLDLGQLISEGNLISRQISQEELNQMRDLLTNPWKIIQEEIDQMTDECIPIPKPPSHTDLGQLISESGITTEPPSAENLFRWIHDTLTNPNPWKSQLDLGQLISEGNLISRQISQEELNQMRDLLTNPWKIIQSGTEEETTE